MNNFFTPDSLMGFNYDLDLGDPGCPPYTRGIYANMYKGKKFTMRQLTGFGSPEDTNKRMKFMLASGATGLSVLFDFPTIQMYDSDDPAAEGHIGYSGVCVDSIEDMKILFDGIDLDKISISIVTHYPTNTAILFAMFLAMAKERGYDLQKLRGSVQNDVTMEEVVRCGSEFISPKDCFRAQCDNIEFIHNNMPLWNPITLNGYNLREAGVSDVTEMAIAFSNAIETLKEMMKRGYGVGSIAKRIAFFWSIGSDFFREVARLRAARRLWYRILLDQFHVIDNKSMMLKCHVQTSGISLTRQEPMNNIVRSSFQALAAVLGGVQSLHVDSYDEAYSVPSQEAALISLRTQQIIQEETGIVDVADPFGGSYYIEELTNQIEENIREEIDNICLNGGFLKLIESGKLHREISEFGYCHQKAVEDGTKPIVGVNKYCLDDSMTIQCFEYPEGVEERQKASLREMKSRRDSTLVKLNLDNLTLTCRGAKNILQSCIDCAHARCTEGEMIAAIKKGFGIWAKGVSHKI